MTPRLIARVSSADEQVAFLLSRFGRRGTWRVVEQRMVSGGDGVLAERAVLETASGRVEVEFRDVAPQLSLVDPAQPGDAEERIERVMERASRFAADNPPHHPGSVARFPVPVEHYPTAVGVPLAIVALDDAGRTGLYAPPRLAVVSWRMFDPIGVRELDDFDPDQWPPPRLGDWPVASVRDLGQEALEASVYRFSACWSRVIDAWFAGEGAGGNDALAFDIEDALRLRAVLDLPTMAPVYRSMNPRFDAWLDQHSPDSDRRSGSDCGPA